MIDELGYEHMTSDGYGRYDIKGINDYDVYLNENTKKFYFTIGDYWGPFMKRHYELIVAIVTKLQALGYEFE